MLKYECIVLVDKDYIAEIARSAIMSWETKLEGNLIQLTAKNDDYCTLWEDMVRLTSILKAGQIPIHYERIVQVLWDTRRLQEKHIRNELAN